MYPTRALLTLGIATLLAALPGCLIRTSDLGARDPRETDASVAVEAGSSSGSDVGLAFVSPQASGHLVSSSRLSVLEPDAQRLPVGFESPRAEGQFRAAVAERYARGDAVKRHTASSTIPLLWGSEDRAVLSENGFFNEQVALADGDRDGSISDAEADLYAGASRRVASR
jgi:hypothetical protein